MSEKIKSAKLTKAQGNAFATFFALKIVRRTFEGTAEIAFIRFVVTVF